MKKFSREDLHHLGLQLLLVAADHDSPPYTKPLQELAPHLPQDILDDCRSLFGDDGGTMWYKNIKRQVADICCVPFASIPDTWNSHTVSWLLSMVINTGVNQRKDMAEIVDRLSVNYGTGLPVPAPTTVEATRKTVLDQPDSLDSLQSAADVTPSDLKKLVAGGMPESVVEAALPGMVAAEKKKKLEVEDGEALKQDPSKLNMRTYHDPVVRVGGQPIIPGVSRDPDVQEATRKAIDGDMGEPSSTPLPSLAHSVSPQQDSQHEGNTPDDKPKGKLYPIPHNWPLMTDEQIAAWKPGQPLSPEAMAAGQRPNTQNVAEDYETFPQPQRVVDRLKGVEVAVGSLTTTLAQVASKWNYVDDRLDTLNDGTAQNSQRLDAFNKWLEEVTNRLSADDRSIHRIGQEIAGLVESAKEYDRNMDIRIGKHAGVLQELDKRVLKLKDALQAVARTADNRIDSVIDKSAEVMTSLKDLVESRHTEQQDETKALWQHLEFLNKEVAACHKRLTFAEKSSKPYMTHQLDEHRELITKLTQRVYALEEEQEAWAEGLCDECPNGVEPTTENPEDFPSFKPNVEDHLMDCCPASGFEATITFTDDQGNEQTVPIESWSFEQAQDLKNSGVSFEGWPVYYEGKIMGYTLSPLESRPEVGECVSWGGPSDPPGGNKPQPSHGTSEAPTGAVRDPSKNVYAWQLIPYRGLRRVARTCQEGGLKYNDTPTADNPWPCNWRKGGEAVSMPQLLNHAISHLYAYLEAMLVGGQPTEDDLAHACWNILVAMDREELELEEREDRETEGPVSPVYLGDTGEPLYVIQAFHKALEALEDRHGNPGFCP